MGIARRKAGTVVRCPTCSGQVVVPSPENEASAPSGPGPGPVKSGSSPAAPAKPGADLFEESDFDELLRPGGPMAPVATVPAGAAPGGPLSGAWGTHAEQLLNEERPPNPGGVAIASPAPTGLTAPGSAVPGGLVLSQGRLAMVTVVAVLLLGLAFLGGVLVGKYLL
jgi:hypothetical protein